MKIELICLTYSEWMAREFKVSVDGKEVDFEITYLYDDVTGTESYTMDLPTLRAIDPEARMSVIRGSDPELLSAESIRAIEAKPKRPARVKKSV